MAGGSSSNDYINTHLPKGQSCMRVWWSCKYTSWVEILSMLSSISVLWVIHSKKFLWRYPGLWNVIIFYPWQLAMHGCGFRQFRYHLLSKMTFYSFKCNFSLVYRTQKFQKLSSLVQKIFRKVSSTLDYHYHSPYWVRNTKSNGVTLEAQLQLRVNFYLWNTFNEWFKDLQESCGL